MNTTLTFIANDQINKLGLVGEHGNAILVENNYGRILFDTGQGLAIEKNLKALNIDINTIDAIAISHGHKDHTGGILHVLRLMEDDKSIKIFGHREIFEKRMKSIAGVKFNIGNPYTPEEINHTHGVFVQNEEPLAIIEDIYLSGYIPRIFEKTKCYQPLSNSKSYHD